MGVKVFRVSGILISENRQNDSFVIFIKITFVNLVSLRDNFLHLMQMPILRLNFPHLKGRLLREVSS